MNRGGVNCKRGTNKVCIPKEMKKEVLELINGPSKGRKPVKGKLPDQLKPFAKIRDKVRAENPNLPYSEVLKLASRIYQKKKGLEEQGYKKKVIPAGKDKGKKVYAKKIDTDEWDDSGDDFDNAELTFESEEENNESDDSYNYDDLTFESEEEEELIPVKISEPYKKMQHIEVDDNSYVPKSKDDQPYELVFSDSEFNDGNNNNDNLFSDSGEDFIEDAAEFKPKNNDNLFSDSEGDDVNFEDMTPEQYDQEIKRTALDNVRRVNVERNKNELQREIDRIRRITDADRRAKQGLNNQQINNAIEMGINLKKQNQGSGFYGMRPGQIYAPHYYQTPYYQTPYLNMRY